MLGWSDSSCVMCGHSSVDLVTETFVSTPTLQVTLQKLCREVRAIHKFDVNRVFKESSSHGGSLFCLPCLATLHGGMSVVSQIICLEQRLKQLAGCIGKKLSDLEVTVGHGTHHRKKQNDLVKEKVSLYVLPESKCPADPIDSEQGEKYLTTDTDIEESSQEPRRKLRKLSKGLVVTSSRKEVPRPSRAPPVNPSTPKSYSILNSLTTRIPGVENCPECDFSVDVRTRAQAKTSTKSMPDKTLVEAWRSSAKEKLALHYRDNHMPNIKRTKDRSKPFQCPQCPYKSYETGKVALHYFRIYVLENKAASSKLSCPTEGCSFFVDIPKRRGIATFQPPQRRVRDALAVHVLTEHDIPSSAIHTAANSARKPHKNTTALFIKTSSNQNEYHCTRCPHTSRLPENPKEAQYTVYRKNFLRHFYDSHLSSSV